MQRVAQPIMIKFCSKCQAETERYASGGCKPCGKKYGAAWEAANISKRRVIKATYRAANKEKIRESTAAWKKANPEYTRASVAAWAKANPEKIKIRSAAYYASNTEKRKASFVAWGKANPEKKKAGYAAWSKANPGALRIIQQNRRARTKLVGGRLSRGLSAKLFKLQKGKCPCCGLPLGDNYHLDHKMPIALGGPNTDDNMQLLRATCNLQKNAKHPVQFMQERGFLL